MENPAKVTRWKVRFFAVWQEGREAAWLKSMSADGWHLKRVLPLFYQFEKGEPQDYEYTLDFMIEARTDMQEYRNLIEDAGWEYVGDMSGWQYFRIDADKEQDAVIYSDEESLKGKYRRVLAILCLSGLPLFTLFLTGGLNRPAVTGTFLIYVIATLMVFLLYAIFRTALLVIRK